MAVELDRIVLGNTLALIQKLHPLLIAKGHDCVSSFGSDNLYYDCSRFGTIKA